MPISPVEITPSGEASVCSCAVFSEHRFSGLMWASSFSDFKYSTGLLCNTPEDATDGMISRLLASRKQSVLGDQ